MELGLNTRTSKMKIEVSNLLSCESKLGRREVYLIIEDNDKKIIFDKYILPHLKGESLEIISNIFGNDCKYLIQWNEKGLCGSTFFLDELL